MPVLEQAQLSQALTGNRGLLEDQIGFETIGRAARLVLAQGVNEQIVKQSDRWGMEDLALQAMGMDPGVGQVDIDEVPIGHIHEGPHQSILLAPPEAFPCISVMAYVSVPSGEQFDQIDQSDITLFVETYCLAGPVPDGSDTAYETIVHRRIQRTTEAVHATLKSSPSLLGTTHPMSLPPRGGIGNASWLSRGDGGTGPRYLRHGSRLQYTLQRLARFNAS
jgi:hypothetical protein